MSINKIDLACSCALNRSQHWDVVTYCIYAFINFLKDFPIGTSIELSNVFPKHSSRIDLSSVYR